jgi:DNA ligase-1
MERFAALLDRLILTPQRNLKVRIIADYFRETTDPDRGYALAALAGDLAIGSVKPAMLRALIQERLDPTLFSLSYDYVGDLAETIALAWPSRPGDMHRPQLGEIVETLRSASRPEGARLAEEWLDALDADGRWALIKLITGGLRIGVSARLAKAALAEFGGNDINEIDALWHGLSPPYETLFAWLEGRAAKPALRAAGLFRPVMLAHALEDRDLATITPDHHAAEWKWDGIRVQAVAEGGERRLYTRTGDDIGRSFPDIVAAMNFDGVIDGELLVFDPQAAEFAVQPFSDLQKRLNRKAVSPALLKSHPAFVRAYDLLALDGDDLRALPFEERRRRLERFFAERAPSRFDLSPLLPFSAAEELSRRRAEPPHAAIEGLMLKRKAAPYLAGRPKGEWWKWKREPHRIDAVLMYAQRGHGKRSSYYSDYTFGVWTEDGTLTPVGKAYFGFTDAELKEIDRFVRHNTTERFGPVRAVAATPDRGLVLEIAFEGLSRSTRHKSGVALRFPRINRLRWDKPPKEADRLATLEAMLEARAAAPPNAR